jgi:hypothetical protein
MSGDYACHRLIGGREKKGTKSLLVPVYQAPVNAPVLNAFKYRMLMSYFGTVS